METKIDYWFTIEPYVFVSITKQCVLLYNTLDGVTIESNKHEVVELLQEILLVKNCGVVLLTNERYERKDVNDFIVKLRDKYMGDIIDVSLSRGKPVQLLPYFNFPNKHNIYMKHNLPLRKNVLINLYEITIHVDSITNIEKLIFFLQLVPKYIVFNIVGNIELVLNYKDLLLYLNHKLYPKNIFCSYKKVVVLKPDFKNNFSYHISVDFPVDIQCWMNTRQQLINQDLSVEYIFDVSSKEDLELVEQFVERFQIKEYRLNPVYTGDNIKFFERNVFLNKEDILSTSMSIKDLFARQFMNIYDFGKINIMSNGDAYANLNHPSLGNIYTDNIYDIVNKEIEDGKSWFRIRNQAPCNVCVYQWLCPSPSNYEIAIGRPNLCHVKNNY